MNRIDCSYFNLGVKIPYIYIYIILQALGVDLGIFFEWGEVKMNLKMSITKYQINLI